MLEPRVQGDLAEAMALLDLLSRAGVEVQRGTLKNRGPYVHQYAVVRLPDTAPAGEPGPIRVQAVVERPALGTGRRELRGRG